MTPTVSRTPKGRAKTNYVLAVDRKEAEELNLEGYGFETEAEAKKARSSPEIDDYYRSKMKIFALPAPERCPNCSSGEVWNGDGLVTCGTCKGTSFVSAKKG